MKAHSDGFKQQIKLMGKEIDSKITFGNTVLGKNELNAVTPSFQGAILKSVMKELHIDSNVEIPIGMTLNYQFGLKVNGNYEYIDFGNYIVKNIEKQEDTNSYKITCYDKMLYSMVEYANMGISYPISVRDYINSLCTFLGLNFANKNDTFANYDKIIPNELYLSSDGTSIDYTFRDVFDELSQVTASTICINENDEVEIKYINDTNDTIDEEHLKDVNVSFGEKFGKINSIVLSRSGESDNVYLRDEQSVIDNGLCELKIIDNQIMNFNNRSDYLPDILEKLNGLEYYLNDFTSTGITYYDVCDRYSVKVGDKTYSCVMFNDEINVTQGLEEIVYTEMPKETQTDYTKADKTDRKINQTYIIVDKQNQEIQALASKVVPVSNIIKDVGQIQLENAYEGILHRLSIKGNISLLFPSSQEGLYGYALAPREGLTPSSTLTPSSPVPKDNKILYPSNNLFSRSSNLIIDDVEYKLDFNFLNYINDTDCDEFIYEDGKCWIVRRVGIDENGNLYATGQEVIEPRKDIVLNVKSNSTIKLKSFENAIYETQYLLENEYTDNFVTEVDVISRINLSPGTAVIEASKLAQITADKINLEGYTTINGGFTIDDYGNPTIKTTDKATDFGVDAKIDIIGTEAKTQVNSYGAMTEWYNSRGYKNNCYLGTNNILVKTDGNSYDTEAMLYSDEESATLSLQLYDQNGNPYNGFRINVFPEKKVRITNQNGGELFMEHVLYENSSGTNGTVTLSESSNNFEYLEIFFGNTDGSIYGYNSLRVHSPNGKYAALLLQCFVENGLYFLTMPALISGTTITPHSIYRVGLFNGGSLSAASNVNQIKIYRVVGYK